jgi:ADP-heptose:LPS heptosyltransferase
LEIVSQHGIENIVFLEMDENDYEFFVEKTGIYIPTVFVQPSFEELCIVINSCKLFVGALSMPLTIAHACQVPRIIGFSGGNDDFFNIGLR